MAKQPNQAPGFQADASNIWGPLKKATFVFFLAATLINGLGFRMSEIALVWEMTILTKSPLLISLPTSIFSLAAFLVFLPLGALADVFDRRRTLGLSEVLFSLTMVALAMLIFRHGARPVEVLAVCALWGMANATLMTTSDAILPQVAGRVDFGAAIALTSASYHFLRAAGPVLGGVLIAAGMSKAFLASALAPLAMVAFVALWRPPQGLTPQSSENFATAVRSGLRYVRDTPDLRAVLVRQLAFISAASVVAALLPVYVRHHLGLTPLHYGMLFGVIGLGGIFGSMAAYAFAERSKSDELVLSAATIVFALVSFIIPQVNGVAKLASVLFFAGVAWSAATVSIKHAIQMAAPDSMRARISSISSLVERGAIAAGSAGWGLVASYHKTPATLRYASVALLGTMALALRYRLTSSLAADEESSQPSLGPLELTAAVASKRTEPKQEQD